MKKIFFSFLAVAAIASCAKTEAVYNEMDSEIKLAPVAAKQTKANVFGAIDGTVYPTAENFDVYGYWKNVGAGETYTDGESFFGATGVEFVNKGNYWGGATPYYWPKNGALRFAAYSPSDLDLAHSQEGDTFTVEGYTQPNETDKTFDFLVAPTSESYTAMTAAENVSVVFEHALSWITLKVKAKDAIANEVFTIKNVTINDINTQADFNAVMLDAEGKTKGMIDYEAWSKQASPAEYAVFEGEQVVTTSAAVIETNAAGTVIIPQETTTVTLTFDQKGVNGTMDMTDMQLTLSLVLDEDDEPWRPGYHYTYTILFGLDEILINPSVEDWEEYNVGELDPEATNVSTAAQLAAALADESVTKITLQKDIEGKFDVNEVAGRTLTINGNGHEVNGSFTLIGNSSYSGATTVFDNINFVAADAADVAVDAFIWGGTLNGDTSTRYPDNVTIKNCTFTATGSAAETVVGAKFWSLKDNLVVEGTTANGLHSLMQLTSCGEATVAIEGVTVDNCKNGISLGSTGKTTIRNSNISTREYGVRADGCKANTSIVNTTIEATQPVIVRKVTTAGYVLNIDDATVLTTSEDYQVIFTAKSDDADYVAPTVGFTYNGPKTISVFPETQSSVASVEELAAALNEVSNVNFAAPIDNGSDVISINDNSVAINMGGHQYIGGGMGTNNYAFNVYGSEVEVNDANIVGAGFAVMDASEVTLNSGSIAAKPGKSGRNMFYVVGNSTVTINEGTYTFDRTSCFFVYVAAGSTCYINGGHYEKPLANAATKDSFVNTGSEGTVIITGGTFNMDPTNWLADGYKAVKSGKFWTVSAE